MSTDTKWTIGTIVPAILVVAGLLAAQIAGLNARIDDVNTNVNARIDDVQSNIRDLRADVQSDIQELRADVRELRALVIDALKDDDPAD